MDLRADTANAKCVRNTYNPMSSTGIERQGRTKHENRTFGERVPENSPASIERQAHLA